MTTAFQDSIRLDSAFEIERMRRTDEGFLDIWGVAATVGVLEYTNMDGSVRREMATAESLESSVPSLRDAPVVVEHPPSGRVDSNNAKQLQVGHVAEAAFDADSGELRVRLRVTDSAAIERIESGQTPETSPGYDVAAKPAPEGADYDLVQVARRVNHLALTRAGRGEAKLRLDSQYIGNQPNSNLPASEPNMEDEEDNGSAEDKVLDRLDSIEEGLVGRFEQFEARLAALEEDEDGQSTEPAESAEADDGEDEGKRMDSEDFPSAFREHRRAVEAAEKLGLEDVSEDSATADIKRAVVKAKQGDQYRADASDERLEGTFDALYPQIMDDKAKRTDSKFESEFAKGRLDATETNDRQDSSDDLVDGQAWLKSVSGKRENK